MKHMKRIIERMRKAIPKDIPKTVVLKQCKMSSSLVLTSLKVNVILQKVISELFVKAQKHKRYLV